jgi:hypothetical protein
MSRNIREIEDERIVTDKHSVSCPDGQSPFVAQALLVSCNNVETLVEGGVMLARAFFHKIASPGMKGVCLCRSLTGRREAGQIFKELGLQG